MWRRIFIFFATLSLSFGILFLSILRTATVKYEFSDRVHYHENAVLGEESPHIHYYLADPGEVLPGSYLWPIKAFRDRAWLFLTTNPGKKADLLLLFADKRLVSGQIIFENDNPEFGLTTLFKAEKYLEQASLQEKKNREDGVDTSDFLLRLAVASLKHFEVLESILAIAPEDARQEIIELQNYSRKTYLQSRDLLTQTNKVLPENPFQW